LEEGFRAVAKREGIEDLGFRNHGNCKVMIEAFVGLGL
jgi:hypothetical protein